MLYNINSSNANVATNMIQIYISAQTIAIQAYT